MATPLVTPRSTPARSLIRNHCFCSRSPRRSGPEDSTGSENVGGLLDTGGDCVTPPPAVVVGVEQLRQEPRHARRQDVDGDTGDHVVDAEGHRGDRVQQPAQGAEQDAAHQGGPPAPLVAGETGPPGAEDHHALEADVDHTGALGEQTAQGGQPDRHRQQQRRRHRRRRRQRGLATDRPDEGEQHQPGEGQPERPPDRPAAGQRSVRGPRLGRGSVVVCTVVMPAPPATRRHWSEAGSGAGASPARGAGRARPTAGPPGGRSSWPRRRRARSCPGRSSRPRTGSPRSAAAPATGRGRRTAAPPARCRSACCDPAAPRRCRGSRARR